VAEDPSEQGRRVFAHTKSNLGALQRSLSFRISDNGVEWGGEIEITDNELIAERSVKVRESRQLDEAKAFLEKVLEAGPMKSDDVKAAAGGIAKNTLWRAHKALEVQAKKTGHGRVVVVAPAGPWIMAMPELRTTFGDLRRSPRSSHLRDRKALILYFVGIFGKINNLHFFSFGDLRRSPYRHRIRGSGG
jgi:hypothetical protein